MSIKSAEFIGSFPDFSKCPKERYAEYAFIGRSNVGKSSLVNMLTNRKDLAKTSSKPGKTQMINFFLVNKKWYLVDLPGYGYAKISKKHRESLRKMIRNYIKHRHELVNTFLLIDSRISPQKIDLEFIEFLGENQIAFSIIFTKADKENSPVIQKNIEEFKAKLSESWATLPPMFITSSVKKIGQEDVLSYIESVNDQLDIKPRES